MSTEVQSNSSTDEVSLAAAFTVEHHDIDAGIERYLADTAAAPARSAIAKCHGCLAPPHLSGRRNRLSTPS